MSVKSIKFQSMVVPNGPIENLEQRSTQMEELQCWITSRGTIITINTDTQFSTKSGLILHC